MLAVFLRLSGVGLRETLILRPSDVRSAFRFASALGDRLRGRRRGPVVGVRGGDTAATMIVEEYEPGGEP